MPSGDRSVSDTVRRTAYGAQRTKVKPAPPPRPAPPPPPGSVIPPIDLLTEGPGAVEDADAAQIEDMGRRLVNTLETFRVGAQIINKTVGPVVTRFELEPGRGVKVGRVSSLADDLALAMRAQSLRIVAPIPGKAAIGIEVPNPTPRLVHVRDLIDSAEFRRTARVLPVVLGRNLEGDEVVDDLTKMPHLLIAGATGSGKSVCINAIITSLVYAHGPDKLKLLMIDPKMVELSMYSALPHLGLPVVTSHHKAANVLKWAVWEMERRYRLLHANHTRNITDFNKKVEETLLGNGDMLFLPPGKSEPLRVQGAFISTDETERLMEWYRQHAPAAAPAPGSSIDEQVTALEKAEKEAEEGRGTGEGDAGERDPLFRQAAEVCIQNQLGSTSLLQRRMSIGYGRAARIIDQLELAGILGPANGSKPRDVLVGLDDLDEICGGA